MSKVLVDTIDTRSGTSTMQIGSTNTTTINLGVSGDTVNIPSGVTIANSGTATGFGLTGWSTGGTSNSLIPSATDQGVYLGVSSATASNLLDDYEEGTFTPTITFSSSTGSITYNTQYGRYTKIGNMVTVWCTVYPSGGISSGSSGTLRMSVPFTCINDTDMHNHGVGSLIYDRLSNSADHFMIQPFIVKNTAYVQIAQMQDDTSGGKSELGQSNMVDNTYIHFSLSYGV